MRNPINKVCIFGALILAASFWSCSTDSDVVSIGEDELSGLHIVDDSVLGNDESADEDENAEEAKSSSSKKVEKAVSSSSKKQEAKSSSSSKTKAASSSSKTASSSAKQESSSSKKDSSASKTESSASKPASSSNVKESSSSKKEEASSDSKEEAKSSSSKKAPHIPGMEETGESSSSKADTTAVKPANSSSSSEKVVPPPSSSNIVKDTINKDTTVNVSNYDDMDKLDSNEQNILDSLISSGDTSLVKIDSVVSKDTLDFVHNDYLCKAPDGSWYRIKDNVFKSFLLIIIDIFYHAVTGNHLYNFTQVCDEIYMRPKG